ncbi:MAG TPA: hypothetical protein VGJ38_04260 [Jatrophihabitantaceae bacterium]
MRALAATPAANANSMQATGTTPVMSYHVLLKRVPNAGASGSSAHVATRPSTAAAPPTTAAMIATLVLIQRRRLIDCVQTNRCVPDSYPRETRGAAQNIPTSSGTAISEPMTGGSQW